MPIEAVKIPQNVQIEDRIIGPITLRQIIISLLGAGLSYAIWSAMKAAGPVSTATTVISWIPAAIAMMFAFVKINDLTLFRLVILMIEKMEKPAVRTWGPRQGLTINIRTTAPKNFEEKVIKHELSTSGISELSTVLDSDAEEAPSQEPDVPFSSPLPVNPSRISIEPLQKPSIDSIAPAEAAPHAEELSMEDRIRDILPPKSHG